MLAHIPKQILFQEEGTFPLIITFLNVNFSIGVLYKTIRLKNISLNL